MSWRRAMRLGLWQKAEAQLAKLPEAERKAPELGYLGAVLALERGDGDQALARLAALEEKLPLLSKEIAERRAEAHLRQADPAQVAAWLAQQGDARSLVGAAEKYRQAKQLDDARRALDKGFRALARLTGDEHKQVEASARALRAQLSLQNGHKASAAGDYRWLALHAAMLPEGESAAAELERIAPLSKLSASQRYERAMGFARRGDVEATENELSQSRKAPGKQPSEAKVLHARGWAHYIARGDYEQAARLLTQAAKLGGGNALRDRFYAARALSRAHRNAEAIERYELLAKVHPKTSWGEQARYLAARLHYIAGEWPEAEKGFSGYIQTHGKRSRYGKTARYSLAVTRLAAGKYPAAAADLEALVKAEDDTRLRARYRELWGVALAGAGRQQDASTQLREVIVEHPLSAPALLAAARLRALGESAPPLVGSSQAVEEQQQASRYARLPPRAALLASLELHHQAELALRQEEAHIIGDDKSHQAELLCSAYGQLQSAGRRYQVGQRAAGWAALKVAPAPATHWLWDCVYPRPYETVVSEFASRFGVRDDLVYAVMRQESAFRPTAESPVGAVGLMQLMPQTALKAAAELGQTHRPEDLLHPAHNIQLGTYYLGQLAKMYQGRSTLMVASYNAGPQAVSRWLQSGEALPLDLFIARIPYNETRNYVYRVVGNEAHYGYLRAGAAGIPVVDLTLPKGLRAPADAY